MHEWVDVHDTIIQSIVLIQPFLTIFTLLRVIIL